MSLLKLWNSLCGRSSDSNSEDTSSIAPAQESRNETGTKTDTATNAITDSVPQTDEMAASILSAAKTNKPKASRSIMGFGSRNPHAELCKLLKPLSIRSLLEVGVNDGSRAIAMLATIQKANPTLETRYCAIDQFELAGSTTSLVQFHQSLRAAGIRARIFPDSIDRGLIQTLHTVGQIDVIVLGVEAECWRQPETLMKLARVRHANSVVFHCEQGKWRQLDESIFVGCSTRKRAA